MRYSAVERLAFCTQNPASMRRSINLLKQLCPQYAGKPMVPGANISRFAWTTQWPGFEYKTPATRPQ
jgi:hypothetical protein